MPLRQRRRYKGKDAEEEEEEEEGNEWTRVVLSGRGLSLYPRKYDLGYATVSVSSTLYKLGIT